MPGTADTTLVTHILALIAQRTGLDATTLHRIGLAAYLTQLAASSSTPLLAQLQASPPTSGVWQRVLSGMNIGETYFLRGDTHFAALRNTIIPALAQKPNRKLNIWCAGCATGEEAYSVALTLHEHLPEAAGWHLNIVATDINQQALASARQAIYRDWSFRHTPPGFRDAYFVRVREGWQLQARWRAAVSFRYGNLLDSPPMPSCDLILCRNVLLYLSANAVIQAENTLYNTLTPGGWLLLGQAEALRTQRERWQMHLLPGAPIYQRADAHSTSATVRSQSQYQYQSQLAQPDALQTQAAAHIQTPTNDRPSDVGAVYADAVQALHAEHDTEAERLIAQVLAQQPDHTQGHVLLAALFANRQAYPEALSHLDAALYHDPLSADAHTLRALIALEQGHHSAALDALQAARYSQRDHLLAMYHLAEVYAQQGDWPRAYRLWQHIRDGLAGLPAEAHLADWSELTAGALLQFIAAHLRDL